MLRPVSVLRGQERRPGTLKSMSELVNQLPALIGVVVGAVMSYSGSALAERSRWRRSLTTRWDEKRLDAYAGYADAVKQETRLSLRIAAALQLGPRLRPLSLDIGLPLLAEAEDRPSRDSWRRPSGSLSNTVQQGRRGPCSLP
jgi:hypothetical protein